MNSKWNVSPGVVLIVFGGFVTCLSIQRLTTVWEPDPSRLLFELFNWAVVAGLTFWGWTRLRRAKAFCPDLTWWQFLRHDLIVLGVGCVILAVVVALSPEERYALVRSLVDIAEALRIARGGP